MKRYAWPHIHGIWHIGFLSCMGMLTPMMYEISSQWWVFSHPWCTARYNATVVYLLYLTCHFWWTCAIVVNLQCDVSWKKFQQVMNMRMRGWALSCPPHLVKVTRCMLLANSCCPTGKSVINTDFPLIHKSIATGITVLACKVEPMSQVTSKTGK